MEKSLDGSLDLASFEQEFGKMARKSVEEGRMAKGDAFRVTSVNPRVLRGDPEVAHPVIRC